MIVLSVFFASSCCGYCTRIHFVKSPLILGRTSSRIKSWTTRAASMLPTENFDSTNIESSGRMSRAAVAQLCSTADKIANLVAIARSASLAKQSGASMLFLPENCGFLGENAAQTLHEAEPIKEETENSINSNDRMKRHLIHSTLREVVNSLTEGNDCLPGIVSNLKEQINLNCKDSGCGAVIVDGLKYIARESGLWISAGGIHEAGAPPYLDDDNDNTANARVYNTHIIIDKRGEIVCSYRKIHLFEVSIPSKQLRLKESETTAPGSEIVVCKDSPLGTLGLSTCYDLRFPEQYIELAKRGAQILLVPSAFTVPTGQAHWHTLLRARAIENQCYVLAAAQYGVHNAKRTSYGHSIAIDPWGVVIADAGGIDEPQTMPSNNPSSPPAIIICDIDLHQLSLIRERLPIQLHRDQAKFT